MLDEDIEQKEEYSNEVSIKYTKQYLRDNHIVLRKSQTLHVAKKLYKEHIISSKSSRKRQIIL